MRPDLKGETPGNIIKMDILFFKDGEDIALKLMATRAWKGRINGKRFEVIERSRVGNEYETLMTAITKCLDDLEPKEKRDFVTDPPGVTS